MVPRNTPMMAAEAKTCTRSPCQAAEFRIGGRPRLRTGPRPAGRERWLLRVDDVGVGHDPFDVEAAVGAGHVLVDVLPVERVGLLVVVALRPRQGDAETGVPGVGLQRLLE